ncbi:SusD/RagB family nutrient-binding outer membrane lipoprotein, partial [Microcoleus sp. herbarium14]|uniref:SusD/RagB family nutrient-binding outer membrane lipoprotein n=1 Tax=Microcoleus sp. herbarium14 TaxID=3055439 RepID=UPI002FD1F964
MVLTIRCGFLTRTGRNRKCAAMGFAVWRSLSPIWNDQKFTPPEVSFSYSEQLLLEAEAVARGFATGGFEVATQRMRAGVRESLLGFGVPATQADAYITGLPALTAANHRTVLAQQQYLDLFMRPVEGWTQHRRSGSIGQEIPAMTTPAGTPVGGLVRRLLYRSEEVNSNPNTPTGL